MSHISTHGFGTRLFVLLGFITIFFMMTQTHNPMRTNTGYALRARFENSGGLRVGSPVSIGGVKIGVVTGIYFDPMISKAVVSLRIYPKFNQIPKDSSASILSQGLLGGKFVVINPGGATTDLQNGDEIVSTQSAVMLEAVVTRLLKAFAATRIRR